MRRYATLLVMLATELGVALLALFFHVRSRAAVLAAFQEFGTEIPPATAVALAPWFMPAAIGAAAVITVIALLAPIRRSRRALVVGAGLVVASAALIFAVWAAFMPIFHSS